MDKPAFGLHKCGEPVTFNDFRPLFDQILIGICGYDFGSATQAIASEQAEMIAFERPYIVTLIYLIDINMVCH